MNKEKWGRMVAQIAEVVFLQNHWTYYFNRIPPTVDELKETVLELIETCPINGTKESGRFMISKDQYGVSAYLSLGTLYDDERF